MKTQTDLSIAVLIDGDNAQPRLLGAILEEVSKYGKSTIRRIYGDWTQSQMNGWKDLVNEYSVTPIQKFSYTVGKNSTDSAMIIDAMDILHSGKIQGFCIVSSDSDYTGLAKRIREEGIFVMGIGQKKTPKAFVNSCEIFTYAENIDTSIVRNSPQKETTEKEEKTVEILDTKWIDKAFELASKDGDEEVFVSKLGHTLRSMDPSFDSRDYGYKNLTKLLQNLPEFELIPNGHNALIRRVD